MRRDEMSVLVYTVGFFVVLAMFAYYVNEILG